LSTGVVNDGSLTSPPTSGVTAFTGAYSTSESEAGGYMYIGPSSTSTCSNPTTSTSGLLVTYTWSVTLYPQLSLTCASGETAYASFELVGVGDVHMVSGAPYWALYPNHAIQPGYENAISCSGSGSPTYSPASSVPVTVKVSTGSFTEQAGDSYEYYTAIFVDSYATESGGGFASAAVSFSATLTSVACNACP
jgi:hypothetical protein